MVATKACPNCSADVPTVAKRCKDCFHDFQVDRPKTPRWAAPMALLTAVAGMVAVALMTLGWIVSQPQDQHIQVDQDSNTITWTRTYVSGTKTEQLKFKDIQRIEYTLHATGGSEVVAVTNDGSRRLIQESSAALQSEAETYAEIVGRDLVTVDNQRGFGTK